MNRIIIMLALLLTISTSILAVPRDMVIVEIGTGTWCQYCPGAAMGADDLVENHHRAAILENHNGDPYANDYSNTRNSYYNINSYPTAYFDGANPSVGGSNTTSLYPSYRTKVNNRLAVPSNFTITASGTHTGLVYNVAVVITKEATDTNTNLKLHGVLTESGLQVNWQGQTHLEYVVRAMAPGATGTDISFTSGNTQTVNLTFTASPAWNAEHFEFVFFLQNNSTKEILQGCKYIVPALENVYPVSVQSFNIGNIPIESVYNNSFTIHNWWTQDMNIDISIDGQDYFVFPQVRDAYTIPFREDMTFDLLFLPSLAGNNDATITITTDNPAYPTITIPVTANVTTTANEEDSFVSIPSQIINIAPNPFREHTTIRYNLDKSEAAELTIYNVKGAKIFSSALSNQSRGEHTLIWSGIDSNGSPSPSGMYFCTLVINGKTVSTQKLIKLK